MIKIILACAGGFSTSLLVSKMQAAALKKGIDVEIEAIAETNVENYSDMDILLLGPQIGHRLSILEKEVKCPVMTIDQYDYGTMNGEKVLEFALQTIRGKKEEN